MSDPLERPPIASAPLSLVLVAHNAANDLEALVADWITQLEARNRPFEMILVDDGSTDDTPRLVSAVVGRTTRLRSIHQAMQLGFGAALSAGIAVAKHPLLAYTTCDRQYHPAELAQFLEHIDKVDLVTGYRQWLPMPPLWRWLGPVWRLLVRAIFGIPLEPLNCWLGDRGQSKRWFARWIFGVRVRDVECAFRLFRRSVFEHLPIQSHGPFAQVEILAKANFLGCLMDEIPVRYNPPAGHPVHGSLKPGSTYLAEASRLFSDPLFA